METEMEMANGNDNGDGKDNKEIECWDCHKKGHKRGDAMCPNQQNKDSGATSENKTPLDDKAVSKKQDSTQGWQESYQRNQRKQTHLV